jgi:hypothetical protein
MPLWKRYVYWCSKILKTFISMPASEEQKRIRKKSMVYKRCKSKPIINQTSNTNWFNYWYLIKCLGEGSKKDC